MLFVSIPCVLTSYASHPHAGTRQLRLVQTPGDRGRGQHNQQRQRVKPHSLAVPYYVAQHMLSQRRRRFQACMKRFPPEEWRQSHLPFRSPMVHSTTARNWQRRTLRFLSSALCGLAKGVSGHRLRGYPLSPARLVNELGTATEKNCNRFRISTLLIRN